MTPTFLPPAKATPSWTVQHVSGAKASPDVRVLVVNARPASERPRAAIIHLHGGGFMMGSPEASLWRSQELAEALNCLVVSVDYRLAPETAFPGALEDNYAALAWVHASAKALGVDRERIAVVGESAGGGHAATLTITARDRGQIPLRFQGLIYPMLDDRTGSTVKAPPHVGRLLWTEERNRLGWSSLLGVPAGSPDVPAGAVPARVTDLAGLPPAWIGVGSIDLFVDEDTDYARRLIAAGVATRLVVTPGAFHLFDAFADIPVSRAFRLDLIAALREAFA